MYMCMWLVIELQFISILWLIKKLKIYSSPLINTSVHYGLDAYFTHTGIHVHENLHM